MCDIADVYNLTNRRARKAHKCCECSKRIEVKEVYEYSSGIFNREPFSYKRCLDCVKLIAFIWGLPETDCIDTGIGEHLSDCDYISYDDELEADDDEDRHNSNVDWLDRDRVNRRWMLAEGDRVESCHESNREASNR